MRTNRHDIITISQITLIYKRSIHLSTQCATLLVNP